MDESEIEERNKWFRSYAEKTNEALGKEYEKYGDYFFCPCCGYPTLSERCGYDICYLCRWEDDGQGDDEADNIWGGPNQDYSLTEARGNFKKYYTKYRSSDIEAFERTTVKKGESGKIIHDKVSIKKNIIENFQNLYIEHNDIERRKLLDSIEAYKDFLIFK